MKPVVFELTATGCWEVTSHARDTTGYPVVRLGSRLMGIYKVMFIDTWGPLAPGEVVRHRCDNNRCINPVHLERGTQLDNIRDRVERNRSAKGERNGKSRLTDKERAEIKGSIETTAVLARRYGVSPATIRYTRSRPGQ